MNQPHIYIEFDEEAPGYNHTRLVKLNDETLKVDSVEIDNEWGRGTTVKLLLSDGCGILTVSNPTVEIKKINTRPNWDAYFLRICEAVAARADCRRAQHGCIIVKKHRIISTGYNGSPSGGPSCLKGECPRGLLSNEECRSLSSYENCFALHAEQNAIAYADGRDTRDAVLYVTGRQCDMCRKLTMAAGIKRVVWPEGEEVFE